MKSTRPEELRREPQRGDGAAASRDLEPAFPFPEPRASQDILVRDLDDAVGNGLILLCSAPTGIGKTAAALYPLLRRLESQGLLNSEWNVEGSRPRRYYVISQEGSKVLMKLAHEWRELTRVMEKLLTAINTEGA